MFTAIDGGGVADLADTLRRVGEDLWVRAANLDGELRQCGVSTCVPASLRGIAEEMLATSAELRRRAALAAAPPPPREPDRPWWRSWGHTVLDVAGLVPVFGEPADGLNALWYAAEGDAVNAGLSAVGMVPILGWGATGTKLVRKLDDAVPALSGARRFINGKPNRVLDGLPPIRSAGDGMLDNAMRTRERAFWTADRVEHVRLNHEHGQVAFTRKGSIANKSRFRADADYRRIIDDAIKSPESVMLSDRDWDNRLNLLHSVDPTGPPVGLTQAGKPTWVVMVVVEQGGRIITAFPY
jgi:hypothetical protein